MISRGSIKAVFLLLCTTCVSAELMGSSRDSSSLQGSSLSNDYTTDNLDTPLTDSQEESSETNDYENELEMPKNEISKRDLLRTKVIDLMKRKFYAMRGKKNTIDYVKRKFYATRGKKDDRYSKRKFYATRGKKDFEDYIGKSPFYAARDQSDYDDNIIKRKFNAMRGKRSSYSVDSEYPPSWRWNQVQQPTYKREFYPLSVGNEIIDKRGVPRGYVATHGR
ncbi:unnamed protein product [Owenia fusiformis]|uniref:Uncharacterized protein n=2 Tax=Owenia fusiformis TaxID=6347 RepID=A0A8J1Y0Y4_OWEFU|nr:unnamed protein product [Owenia fusiformis]